MAKHIAENIVGILNDAENDDLDTYFNRTLHDWKWKLRENIKQVMRSNTRILKQFILHVDFMTYVEIINKNLGRVSPMNMILRIDTAVQYDDPDIVPHISGQYSYQIIDQHLQTFIDYCKSLNLNIWFESIGVRDELYVSWKHWKK